MSGAPLVTLDIGNTRCKACRFPAGAGAPRALFDVALEDAPRAVSEELRPQLAGGEVGAISCVAEPEVAQMLRAALEDVLGAAVALHPDAGLVLEIEHPETLGADRLYAARGALELEAAPAIVVDAGTALTVDALDVDEQGRGHFLGGAIAPGPELMAEALAARGARLWKVDVGPGTPALGKHTEAALAAGACVGFEMAALGLVRRVALEAGFWKPRIVLTGGRREWLAQFELGGPGPRRSLVVEPWLVQRGLAAAVRG